MDQSELDAAVDRLNAAAPGYGDVVRVLTPLVAAHGYHEAREVLRRVLPGWRPNWE